MTSNTFKIGMGIFIIILTALSASAAYVDPNVDEKISGGDDVEVLVILNDEPEAPSAASAASRRETLPKIRERLEARLEARKGRISERQEKVLERIKERGETAGISSSDFKLKHKYSTINGFSGNVNRAALERLKNDPDIKAIYSVPTLTVSLDDSVPLIKASNVHQVQVNGINITGAGETVCVLDTGINTNHEAFNATGKILDQYCYCNVQGSSCCPNGQDEDSSAEDDHSHGSHCANIAAGNGTQSQGVAPRANIVAIKVCNSAGSCSSDDMIAGIDWCINNASTYNISAISISIGDDAAYTSANCPDWGFLDPVNTARGMDIMVAISSGNEYHSSGIAWPACIDNATSVGASSKLDAMASYTNTGGDMLDLIAPGGTAYNCNDGICSACLGNTYCGKPGTSMATPHIAGAYLLLQHTARLEGASWTVDEIENAMKVSAGVHIEGYPRIDVISALNYLKYNYSINSTANSISKNGTGKIKYNTSTNFTDVGDCISLSYNNITVNSENENCSQYNKSAEITIEGLPFAHAKILRDGQDCPPSICAYASYSYGTLRFNATKFSSYSGNGTTGVIIWDDTDYARKDMEQQIRFYANFSNSTAGPINGTGVNCEIKFNLTGSWQDNANMTFNSSSLLHEYNISFAEEGDYYFHVMCNGTSQGHSIFNATDDFSVDMFPNTTQVIVNSTLALNRTEESITCWAEGDNEELDYLYAYYSWYNNSVLFSSGYANISNGTLTNISTLPITATKENEQWMCRVFMGDTWVNETDSTNRTITILNTPPYFAQNLSNQTTAENSTLYYDINCSDADENDGVDTVSYYINDTSKFPINISSGEINWTPGFWDNGTYWYNVTCGDSTANISQAFRINVTNTNRAPTNLTVKVNTTHGNNYTDENITCWAKGVDEDNDGVTAHFIWFNNSANHSSGISAISGAGFNNISTINSSITQKNDTWICSVKLRDPENNETQWHNASITIANAPPRFTPALTDQNVDENATLYYDINCTDADGETPAYYINDTSMFQINSTTGEINWTTGFEDEGIYDYNATCSEGIGNSSGSFRITVGKTNRVPYNTSIKLNSSEGGNYSGEDLTCWASGIDDDNDTIIAHFLWFNGSTEKYSGSSVLNGTGFSNAATLDGMIPNQDENWTCSIKLGDSDDNETDWHNATITMINDTEAPNVTLVSPANSSVWTSSSTVGFTYHVADNLGIENCTLIIDGNESQSSASVTNNADNAFSIYLANGGYEWKVNCTDGSKYSHSSVSQTYSVTVSYTPSVSRGGGGGGGAPSCNSECAASQRGCVVGKDAYVMCGNYDADECLEWGSEIFCEPDQICMRGFCEARLPSWVCDDWSECVNSTKTRRCLDMDGIAEPKTESMDCEIVVFEEPTEEEPEKPAPPPKPSLFRKAKLFIRNTYREARPYIMKTLLYLSIAIAVVGLVMLISMGVKDIEKYVKTSNEVIEYQQTVESDFRRLLHMKKKKR